MIERVKTCSQDPCFFEDLQAFRKEILVSAVVDKAKQNKKKIEAAKIIATEMANSDVDLILMKVDTSSSYMSPATAEEIGRCAMEDMISFGEAAVARVVDHICRRSHKSMMIGALKVLMTSYQQRWTYSGASVLQQIYMPFLLCKVTPIDCNTWHVLASVMTISMNHGHDAHWHLLPGAVMKEVEKMKKNDPIKYGRYYADEDKCPIIDILLPVYKAIGHDAGSGARTALWKAIKDALLESASKVEKIVSHAMPNEAEIVRKKDVLQKNSTMSLLISSFLLLMTYSSTYFIDY